MELVIEKIKQNHYAVDFCKEFVSCNDKPKFIFGRNEYAESISKFVIVDGYIDEFTEDTIYLGKPIVKLDQVPKNALVVSAVLIVKPLIAEKKLNLYKITHLDYFSFYKYSGLNLKPIMFWDNFQEDFKLNFSKFQYIYDKLADEQSKDIYYRIINFRNSYDLDFMRIFSDNGHNAYFEPFLKLKEKNESFVDVGGFDGFTTSEFIKRCPLYDDIYFFEPEQKNLDLAKVKLEGFKNISFIKAGLSNKKQILKFDISGSSSKISENGTVEILVEKLDDIVKKPVTFIKMDIEGSEKEAIEGSYNVIKNYHPKLAIAVYHKMEDFWVIPELILGIRNDYDVYLRHYTEGITETIMFFVPQNK